jgi:predicted O-linked N-acetylglucosamine transferase (SPINDLY family)
LNLNDWLAGNEDEYLAIAVKQARDLASLAQLRASLRKRMGGSHLCDTQGFTQAVEQAYVDMAKSALSQGGG